MSRPHARVLTRHTVAVVLVALSVTPSLLAQGAGQPEGAGQRRQRAEGDAGGGRRGGGMFGGGGSGMRGMFEPSVTTRQIDAMKGTLKFSKEQDEAVKALFDAYQDSSNDLISQAREKMDAMREEMRAAMGEGGAAGGGDAFKKMGEEAEKMRKARKDLETSFFNDVKSVLNPDQIQKWPSVERAHRRESSVGRGLMSGERLDVVRMVEDLKLADADKSALATVLEQYEVELDRDITARNEVYDRVQSKMRELMQSGDTEQMQKLFDEGRAASVKVRDVNRRFARQVEGTLPEEAKAKFTDTVNRDSFPLIYRPTMGTRTIEAANKLSDLDDGQKTSLQSIADSYKRELGTINKEMEGAYQKREASFSPADLMGGRGRGGMGDGGGGGMFGDDEQSQQLRERRRTLDETTIEKIKALLKPEQVEQLPTRERGDGPAAGGGGGLSLIHI